MIADDIKDLRRWNIDFFFFTSNSDSELRGGAIFRVATADFS